MTPKTDYCQRPHDLPIPDTSHNDKGDQRVMTLLICLLSWREESYPFRLLGQQRQLAWQDVQEENGVSLGYDASPRGVPPHDVSLHVPVNWLLMSY